jgi:actin related protein 2/3 complex subunit 1A/1B
MKMFNMMDRSRSDQSSLDTQMATIHKNSITQVTVYSQERGQVNQVTTCGLDGNVVLWDLKALEGQFRSLRLN